MLNPSTDQFLTNPFAPQTVHNFQAVFTEKPTVKMAHFTETLTSQLTVQVDEGKLIPVNAGGSSNKRDH